MNNCPWEKKKGNKYIGKTLAMRDAVYKMKQQLNGVSGNQKNKSVEKAEDNKTDQDRIDGDKIGEIHLGSWVISTKQCNNTFF